MELELEVFQQFKPKLITAIGDSVLNIANECQACGLITGTYEKIVHKDETPTKQATLLVDAVEKCITTDCDNFEVFMGILDDGLPPACKKPLSEMRERLKFVRNWRICTDENMEGQNSIVDVPKSSNNPFRASVVSKQKRQKDFTKPGQPNSGKILAHSVSTDSGISVGRSDSVVSEHNDSFVKLNSTQSEDLAPIEETPLDDKSAASTQVMSTTCPPLLSTDKTSDKMWNLQQELTSRFRDLRLETMQKEAVEISLKEDIEQLREELDRMVKEKQKAEKELYIKQREVAKLTSTLKCERRKLEDMTEAVDGLKTQVADGEASRDKLVRDYNRQIQKQKNKYELEAVALKAKIEDKERVISELRSEMLRLEHRNALLQRSNSYEHETEWRSESVEVVLVQRSNSYDLREEIQKKDTKLQETKDKLYQCEKQLSKEQGRQCTYMVVIGLLVVVIAIVAYLYINHRESIHCINVVRDFPM